MKACDSRTETRRNKRITVSDKTVILVVEDEPLLRLMAVDLVEEAGFVALEAANADDAVAILERRDDIRIVFTDIDMPGGMDGMKLAAAIRDRWPPISIIVASGLVRKEDVRLPSGATFFSKPYNPEAVTTEMRRMLG